MYIVLGHGNYSVGSGAFKDTGEGVLQFASVKKRQKVKSIVRDGNIDEVLGTVLFANIEAVDNLIENLQHVRRFMEEKRETGN